MVPRSTNSSPRRAAGYAAPLGDESVCIDHLSGRAARPCHDGAVNRTVDYTALIFPTTRAEVAAFRAEAKTTGQRFRSSTPLALPTSTGFAIIGVVIVIFFAGRIITAVTGAGSVHLSSWFTPIAMLAVAIAVAAAFAIRAFSNRNWETWMRLSRFAAANGLRFSAQSPAPTYPGAIFGVGSSRTVANHLQSTTGRFLDIGNYHYVTGSGKSRQHHSWGFLALRLDRRLPNMLLDAKANNGMFGGSNLPVGYRRDQVLSLEGDFDRYFTLYCPRQYERDALYVFTPDLMALLIDEAAPFDVEIIDDWMFVYSAAPFEARSPAIYQRLFRIIETVGAKTLSQTDRYADERIGDPAVNLVAPAGQRLRRGISTSTIIVIVIAVVLGGQSVLQWFGR